MNKRAIAEAVTPPDGVLWNRGQHLSGGQLSSDVGIEGATIESGRAGMYGHAQMDQIVEVNRPEFGIATTIVGRQASMQIERGPKL